MRLLTFLFSATLAQPLEVLTRRRILTRATAPLLEKVDTVMDTKASRQNKLTILLKAH
jgi:hypothetical protein